MAPATSSISRAEPGGARAASRSCPGDALHRRRPGHQLRRRALAGRAGRAGELSRRTQVIFLSHHGHLVEVAREVFGENLNVVRM